MGRILGPALQVLEALTSRPLHRLAGCSLVGILALGGGGLPEAEGSALSPGRAPAFPAAAPGQTQTAGRAPAQGNDSIVTLTAAQPAVIRLGPAPSVGSGNRRVVTGRIVGMEPPAAGAISIEAWLSSRPDQPAMLVGRFSPFPVVRIDPKSQGQHQPFLIPVDSVVPEPGGGDWTVEFRLSAGPGSARGPMLLQLADVVFATD